jgi:hypothetical protein
MKDVARPLPPIWTPQSIMNPRNAFCQAIFSFYDQIGAKNRDIAKQDSKLIEI